MRVRHYSVATAIPLKLYLQRTLFFALLCASIFLIYAERQDSRFMDQMRLAILDAVLPVVDVLASPIEAVDGWRENLSSLMMTYRQNQQLKLDNARLMDWRATAIRLESENRSLRDLLNYSPPQARHYVTAKVIGSASGSISQRMHVNMGSDQGLMNDQAVVNEYGLIGRVIQASGQHAEILLITDMSSRIPVQLQPSGQRAILVGDNQRLPYLKFYDPKAKPQLGDTVLTAPDGGVLPEGIQIGKIFSERNGSWKVRPSFKEKNLNYVRVIQPSSTPAHHEGALDATQ